MRTTILNDQHIVMNVPADFRVNIATHSVPGDYDSLFYNEFEIGTYERYEDYDSVKLYSQAFWVSADGVMLINLYSLDEVKSFL